MVADNIISRIPVRFLKFAVVGGSGVIVNMGMLFLFTEFIGIHYLISSPLAIEISILANFLFNDMWTWGDRRQSTQKSFIKRMLQYNLSAGASAFLVNYVILTVLTEGAGLHYLISNLIGIGAGVLLNYFLNDKWTYKAAKEL